jgi:hypothetical protein
VHLLSLVVKGDARGYTNDIIPYIDEDVDWLAVKCAFNADSVVLSNTQDVLEIVF